MRRYREFRMVRQEAFDLRQTLADRKVVEQAKQTLIDHASLEEHEAFARLEALACQENCSLRQASQMVLKVAQALRPSETMARA
jgi:AmiR/NasT family two-component response regulator